MARLAPWLLILVFTGCTAELLVGEECTDSADCSEGLSCFFADGTMVTALCMEDCDDTMVRLCSGGEVCIPAASMGVPRDEEVCFLGGPTAVGSPCVDPFECVAGSICVDVGGEQSCLNACDTSDDAPTICLSTEVCEPLSGMATKGFCATVMP